MDYNIDNYTDQDLYALIDLEVENDLEVRKKYSRHEIIKATKDKINTLKDKNFELKNFFNELLNRLLDNIYESGDQDTVLINPENNIFKSGANETKNVVPISSKKGDLNPNFKNTIKRTLNIDSRYRQNSFPVKNGDIRYSDVMTMSTSIYSATDFTCNFTDSLTNVISMHLYSYYIPYSWYSINKHNNTFKINGEIVIIEPGNYGNEELVQEISNNDIFIRNGGSIEYDSKTNKVTIEMDNTGELLFYTHEDTFIESRANYNLGWTLGYRNNIYEVKHGVLKNDKYRYLADSIINIRGPKYIVMIIDEFSSNVDNVGMISIETSENKLAIPNYYSNDLTFSAERVFSGQELSRDIAQYGTTKTINNVNTRGITRTQQITLNEIIKSRNETVNKKLNIPRDNNAIAIIPVKKGNFGEPIDIFGGIKELKRVYFGPLTINKLQVKLMDDSGFVLDLNGLDWSVSLITEHLYKYS